MKQDDIKQIGQNRMFVVQSLNELRDLIFRNEDAADVESIAMKLETIASDMRIKFRERQGYEARECGVTEYQAALAAIAKATK